jgi:hypothetical protein
MEDAFEDESTVKDAMSCHNKAYQTYRRKWEDSHRSDPSVRGNKQSESNNNESNNEEVERAKHALHEGSQFFSVR